MTILGSPLPDPPIPATCDLSGYPCMMIDTDRLFSSRFDAHANDTEWRAGFTLWLKSKNQKPAGSLPNDDVELARLVGYGSRGVKRFQKIKSMALHNWFLCSDGRLYHKFVAQTIIKAWLSRLNASRKSEKGNAKKYGCPFDSRYIDNEINLALSKLELLEPNIRKNRKYEKECEDSCGS